MIRCNHGWMVLSTLWMSFSSPITLAQTSFQSEFEHSEQTESVTTQHSSQTVSQTSSIAEPRPVHSRAERRVTRDLLNYPGGQLPTIRVRCQSNTSYDSDWYDSDWIESDPDDSPVRDLLRDRESSLMIEIRGHCEEVRVRWSDDSLSEGVYPGHSESWNGDRPEFEPDMNSRYRGTRPWLTRTGSGWDWLLRNRDRL